jgi:hypothetical protein
MLLLVMTKYKKNIWSSPRLVHQKKTWTRIIKAKIEMETLQEHEKEVKKANMDFKNKSGG